MGDLNFNFVIPLFILLTAATISDKTLESVYYSHAAVPSNLTTTDESDIFPLFHSWYPGHVSCHGF